MRNLTPVIAAVLVLAGCSSASTVTAPDLAACDRAMRAQDAATAAGGATATRPPECAGVGDTDLQRLASSALADAVSSSLAVPPPSSTIAAPTTAAGRLTTAQAAAVYAAAVAPVNAIGEQLKDAIKGPVPDMTKVHQLAAKLKTAYRRVLDTLLHTSWPVEVQAAVDSLATTTAALVSWAETVTQAETPTGIPPSPSDGSAAQLVRAKLGLPAS